jgi:hypothetical protein
VQTKAATNAILNYYELWASDLVRDLLALAKKLIILSAYHHQAWIKTEAKETTM